MNKNLYAYFIICNENKTSKIIKYAKKTGLNRSTIIPANGSVQSNFSNFLGIFNDNREVIIFISDKETGDFSINKIREKFKMDKPKKGIGFKLKVEESISEEGIYINKFKKEKDMNNKLIFTIVDRDKANEVIDIASKAGACGGTILHGRGSGKQMVPKLFNLVIEPEKDIVIIIVSNNIKEKVISEIRSKMGLDKPNKGILFVLNLEETFGLYQQTK